MTYTEEDVEVALNALIQRNVWDDENEDELLLIAGWGYTESQVESILNVWCTQTGYKFEDIVQYMEIEAYGGDPVTAVQVRCA